MKVNSVTLRILNRRGQFSYRELADALGIPRSTLSCTLLGLRRNPELQERIAAHFGFTPRGLWGRWYNPAGRRVMPGRRPGRQGRLLSPGGPPGDEAQAPARVAS